MARRRNSCEDCTTSVSHCCGTCLQYTLHTPHPPHHSPTQHSIAQLTTPHRQQASIPLSMSTMRRCAECKSSLGLGQHEGKRRKHCDTHTQTFAHTHSHTLFAQLQRVGRNFHLAHFETRHSDQSPRISLRPPRPLAARPKTKQNKTNSAIKNDKVAAQRAPLTQNGTNALSEPAALFTSYCISLSLALSRCGHSVINIYHISTL